MKIAMLVENRGGTVVPHVGIASKQAMT